MTMLCVNENRTYVTYGRRAKLVRRPDSSRLRECYESGEYYESGESNAP